MTRVFDNLEIRFVLALAETGFEESIPTLVQIVRETGGEFITVSNQRVQVHPDTMSGLLEKDLFHLRFEHALLARPAFEAPIFAQRKPTATLSYLDRHDRVLSVTQSGGGDKSPELNSMALGQLKLGEELYVHLRVPFGSVDQMGARRPNAKIIQNQELPYLFWAMFFGPTYIQKYGRDFFMAAPVWKKQPMSDGGLLIVVTKNYHEWWQEPPKDVVDYFETGIPGIIPFRAEPRHY
jgi:hypothetical protein